jgi:ABC-type Fe3+ transport system permease subunit
MRLAHLVPLLGFLIPTVAIGYGVVIPGSCIAGVNEHTVGFATSLLAASVTYVVGVRQALRS